MNIYDGSWLMDRAESVIGRKIQLKMKLDSF